MRYEISMEDRWRYNFPNRKDLKVVHHNVCYYFPDGNSECSCNRAYFDVLADFQPTRIVVCQNWLAGEIKSYVYNKISNKHSRYSINDYLIGDARRDVLKSLIYEHCGSTVYEMMGMRRGYDEYPVFELRNTSLFDLTIIVQTSMRPSTYVTLSAMGVIRNADLVKNEWMDYYRKRSLDKLFEWIDAKRGYKKYAEYRKIYDKVIKEARYSDRYYMELTKFALELIQEQLK